MDASPLVVLLLGGQRYALALAAVDRVIRAVAVTPLAAAPEAVLGVVDIGGSVLPVLDLRRRFGLPPRALAPSDRLVLACTSRRRVALVADSVVGVEQPSAVELVDASAFLPGARQVAGVLKQRDGMILIHDLERFLSAAEERSLEAALSPNPGEP